MENKESQGVPDREFELLVQETWRSSTGSRQTFVTRVIRFRSMRKIAVRWDLLGAIGLCILLRSIVPGFAELIAILKQAIKLLTYKHQAWLERGLSLFIIHDKVWQRDLGSHRIRSKGLDAALRQQR